MDVEVRARPADQASRDRILAVIFDGARAAGLPFEHEEVILEAWDGEAWRGGASVRMTQGWMFVLLLGVAEAAQGRGVGTRLLRAAEQEARRRGLIGVWLDTYSFQAPGFYAKLGYEEVGRIPDYPPGHARIFLAKRLDGGAVQGAARA